MKQKLAGTRRAPMIRLFSYDRSHRLRRLSKHPVPTVCLIPFSSHTQRK